MPPLWGSNNDPIVASSNKPKWLNPTHLGTGIRKFKKRQNAANTFGVSKAEVANTARGVGPGWVWAERGTGPVVRVDIAPLTPGNFTVNTNVSVAFSATQGGSGANGIAQFTGGNLTSILIDNGGVGYNSAPTVTISGGNGNTTAATLVAAMGGRCGRLNSEILVWVKNVVSDDAANDNPIFGA